jgi:hypothetical protein
MLLSTPAVFRLACCRSRFDALESPSFLLAGERGWWDRWCGRWGDESRRAGAAQLWLYPVLHTAHPSLLSLLV